MRRRLALTAVAVLALVAAGCSTDDGLASAGSNDRGDAGANDPPGTGGTVPGSTAERTPVAGFPDAWQPGELDWQSCDIGSAPSSECTVLTVPLDWAAPDGDTIELALARIPATGERIGSLLTNPGGPGGSGLEFLAHAPFSPEVSERFDVVSWDPRGVGASTSVTCGDTVEDFLAEDPSPDDPTEQAAIEDAAAEVAEECAAADGDLLAHVGTAQVARDLEAIRLALGGEPLNYVGFSYGTQIGQAYAEQFGDRIRTMTLDGVVDPALGFEEFLLGQVEAFEAAFDDSVAACAEAGREACGVADLAAAYDEVAATVEEDRLAGGPDGVGPAELAVAATYSAYLSSGWTILGPALADALDGDGGPLWDLASSYYDFGSFGAYAAVVCTDTEHPVGVDAYRDFYDRAVAVSERFGPTVANEMLPCATWGVPPQDAAAAVTAPDAPPILVVGNTGDPATPLENAEHVAASLDSGDLVVVDMDGHIAYGANRCLTDTVDAYLIELVVPEPGTRC